jgi:hypothetical protein
MGLFHVATLSPTKEELLADWVPTQPWAPSGADATEVIGSFRFDDPEGRVGIETHLVRVHDVVVQVPLTYRDEPLEGGEQGLIAEMEHSVLGTRWVYDGLLDPRFVLMLAGAALTGQGEVLGLAQFDGRWYVSPAAVRIDGGGWIGGPVAVDELEPASEGDAVDCVFRNDRFELTLFRRPGPGPVPAMGLTATWEGQDEPVVLAEVREH